MENNKKTVIEICDKIAVKKSYIFYDDISVIILDKHIRVLEHDFHKLQSTDIYLKGDEYPLVKNWGNEK